MFSISFQNSIIKINILFSLNKEIVQDCASTPWAYKWPELYWTDSLLPSLKSTIFQDKVLRGKPFLFFLL